MYNDNNASMAKRRRENRRRVAAYTRKKAYEPANKKYVDDIIKSSEEIDYFEKVETPKVEEEVKTEPEVQNEEENEVYNKIRAWREITDKEEKKKEEPVIVNDTESDNTVTESEDEAFEDINEVVDIVENSAYITDHVDEMIDEIEYEGMMEAVEDTPVETDENPNVESIFLGTVMTRDELETQAVKDVLETLNTNVDEPTKEVGYIWVVDEDCMYYHKGNEWIKDDGKKDIENEEDEEINTEKKEIEEEIYQFVYEPETEEDDDEDLGYTSLITEAGEELTEDQKESLDGIDDPEFLDRINQDIMDRLTEESKGYKEQNEEPEYVDIEDMGTVDFQSVENLPTLEEIYADLDEDDFVIESEDIDYKEELENDTEDYSDEDVEIWDDEFEDGDMETVIEDDNNYTESIKYEPIEIPEIEYIVDGDKVSKEEFDDAVESYKKSNTEDYSDEDVEIWDDEFEDEDMETVIEDDEVPFYDEDEEDYYDLNDAADYEESFEDPYFEDDEMVEYIQDEFNDCLDITTFTEKGKELPNKLLKGDTDLSKAILHIETMDDEGYSVTDLISITKYLLLKLNSTITTDGIDDEILSIVMERLSEAQLWLDKWSNR